MFNWVNYADIGNNLIASLLFAMAALLIVISLYIPRRFKLYRFFGLNKNERLVFYLSSLNVPQGGGLGYQGRPSAFSGAVIPNYEFEVIPKIANVLNYFTSQSGVKNRLANAILGNATVKFACSPQSLSDVEHANLITVGGPHTNLVTQHYLSLGTTVFDFLPGGADLQIQRGADKGQTFTASLSQDIGMLEKIYDKDKKVNVFIAAGANTNGTRGTLEYLIDHWEELYKKYKGKSFALCIRFPQPHQDPRGYKTPVVLFEKSEE